jgi:single-stranded DNA-binding protein
MKLRTGMDWRFGYDDSEPVLLLYLPTRHTSFGIVSFACTFHTQGQTAEFVAKYVDKGARIGVVGQLQVDTWIDKNTGEKRSKPKIIVRDLDMLETKAEAEFRRSGRRRSVSDDEDDELDDQFKAGSGDFFD